MDVNREGGNIMNEKIYKTISIAGAGSIAVGVVALVTGVVTGVLSIVCGSVLLKRRKDVTF
jgi:hypothetical protein